MSSIDNRIVKMEFDNSRFESNVQTTMSTLDKLKQKLHLDDATKGFQDVEHAASKCDLSPLSRAVDSLGPKFSAMEVMAKTALFNITNSVVDAGKRITRDFTIAPMSDGMKEYETKMGAVQTIMASTGESLDTVNKYLDELNTYADKTIYSFSDMTESIGKFTNSGVSLDDAVKAIQGISNEAAVSGANANEASRAMYNFAQALSTGYVQYIDWKSIENANMATKEFKEQLIETAVSMGTLKEAGNGMYKTLKPSGNLFNATANFKDALNEQWLTSEVLVKTLAKYADETTEIGKKAFAAAQDVKTFSQLLDTLKEAAGSGWAQTYELIFGNLEEAKELWTSVSDVVGGFIGSVSDARNELLKAWKEAGGREDLLKGLADIFRSLGYVIKKVGEELRKLFPPTTVDDLTAISSKVKEFGEYLTDLFGVIEEPIDENGQIEVDSSSVEEAAENVEQLTTNLRNGSRGDEVRKLQQHLADLGYDLGNAGVDGIFGPKTEAALKKFQKDMEITVDGIYGKDTHRKLQERIQNDQKAIKDAQQEGAELNKQIADQNEDVQDSVATTTPVMSRILRIAKGIFAIFDIVKQSISFVATAIKELALVFTPLGDVLFSLTAGIADVIYQFNEWLKESEAFKLMTNQFTKWLAPIGDAIKSIANWLSVFLGFSEAAADGIDQIQTLPQLWEKITTSISKLGIWEKIEAAIEAVKTAFSTMWSTIEPILSSWGQKIQEVVGDKFYGLLTWLSEQIPVLAEQIGNGFLWILESLVSFAEWIPSAVQSVDDFFNGFTELDPVKQAMTIFQKFGNLIKTFFGFGEEVPKYIYKIKTLPQLWGRIVDFISGQAIWGKLGEAVENLKTAFANVWNELKEIFLGPVQAVTDWGDWFDQNIAENFYDFLTNLGNKIPQVAKRLGEFLLGIIEFVTPLVSKIPSIVTSLIGFYNELKTLVQSVDDFFNGFTELEPVKQAMIIFQKFGNLIKTFLGFGEEVPKYIYKIKTLPQLWGRIVDLISGQAIWGKLGEAVENLKTAFANVWDELKEIFLGPVQAVTDWGDWFDQNIAENFYDFLTNLGNKIPQVAKRLGEFLLGIIEFVTPLVSKIPSIVTSLIGFYNELKTFFSNFSAWIKSAAGWLSNFIGFGDDVAIGINRIESLPQLWGKITKSIGALDVWEKLGNAIQKLKDTFATTWENLKAILFGSDEAISDFGTTFKQALGDKFYGFLTWLGEKIPIAAEWIGNGLLNIVEFITPYVSKIPSIVATLVEHIQAAWGGLQTLITPIGDWISRASNWLSEFLGFGQAVEETVEEGSKQITNWWQATPKQMQGIAKMIFGVGETASEVVKRIETLPQLWSKITETVGQQEVWQKLGQAIEKLKNAFSTMWESLKAIFTGSAEAGSNFGEALQESLGDKFYGFLTWLGEKIPMVVEWIGNGLLSIVEFITPFVSKIPSAVTTLINFGGKVKDFLTGMWQNANLIDRIKDAWSKLTTIFAPLGDLIKRVGNWLAIFLGFRQTAEEIAEEAVESMSIWTPRWEITRDMWKVIEENTNTFSLFGNAVSKTVKLIKTLPQLWSKITETIGQQEVWKQLGEAIEKLKNAFSTMWESLKAIFIGSKEDGASFGEALQETIGDKFYGFLTWLSDIIPAIAEIIGKFLLKAVEFITFIVTNLPTAVQTIKDWFGKISEFLTGLWQNIRLVDRVKSAYEGLKTFFTSLIDAFKGFFGGLGSIDNGGETQTLFQKIGGWFGQLGEAIANLWQIVKKYFADKFADLWPTVQPIFQQLGDSFSALCEAIKQLWLTIKTYVSENLVGIWTTLTDDISNFGFVEGLKVFFKELGNTLRGFFKGFGDLDLGTQLQTIFKRLGDWFTKLGEVIVALWEIVRQYLVEKFSGLWTTLQPLFQQFGDTFAQIGEAIKQFWQTIKAYLAEKFPSLWAPLEDSANSSEDGSVSLADKLYAVFSRIGELFSQIKNWIIELWKRLDLKNNFQKLVERIKTIFSQIADFFKQIFYGSESSEVADSIDGANTLIFKIDLKTVQDWIDAIAAIVQVIIQIITEINIAGLVSAIRKLVKSFSSIPTELSKFGKANDKVNKPKKTWIENLKDFAIAVGLIIAAIWILGTMDTDKLKQGSIALGSIIGVLLLIAIVGSVLDKKVGKTDIGHTALQFAGAVTILTGVIWLLSKMPWTTFLNGLGKLAFVMLELVAFMFLVNKFGGGTNIQYKGLIGVSVAIGILYLILRSLGKMNGLQFLQGLGFLTLIMGELIGFMILVNKLGGGSNIQYKGLIGVSIAIGILYLILRSLGKMNGWQFAQGLFFLTLIMGELGAFIWAVNKYSKGFDYGGLWSIVGAIAVLSTIAYVLGSLNFWTLLKGVGSVGLVMVALVLFVKYLNKYFTGDGSAKKYSGLLVIVGAIGILSIIAVALGLMNTGKMWQGISGLVAIMAALVVFIHFLNKEFSNTNLDYKGLLLIVGAISALGIIAIVLGLIPMDSFWRGIGGLIGIMAALLGFIFVLKKLLSGDQNIDLWGLYAVVVAIGILGGIAALIGHQPWDVLVKGVGALAVIMALVGAFIWALTKYCGKDKKISFGGLFGVIGAIFLLGVIAWGLGSLPKEVLIKGLASVGSILLLLGIFMIAVSRLSDKKFKFGALTGIILAVGALSLIAVCLGVLPTDMLKQGLVGLGVIVVLLGAFMILVSQLTKKNFKFGGLTAVILAIGALSLIAVLLGLCPIDVLKKGIGALATVMILLGAFIILTNKFGGGIKNALGILLSAVALVGVMMGFALALSMLPSDMDWNKIAAFATGITLMMMGFSMLMAAVHGATWKDLAIALVGVLGLFAIIAGVIAAWAKLQQIEGFQEFMNSGAAGIGEMIGTFIGSIQGSMQAASIKSMQRGLADLEDVDINEAALDNILAIADKIAQFEANLPGYPDWTNLVPWARSDLTILSQGIEAFGQAAKVIAVGTALMPSPEEFAPKVDALLAMAEQFSKFEQSGTVPTYAPWMSWNWSDTNMESFGKDMQAFAAGATSLVAAMSVAPAAEEVKESFAKVQSVAEVFSEFQKSDIMPDYTGWESWNLSDTQTESFSKDMTAFGRGMASFAAAIMDANVATLSPEQVDTAIGCATAVAKFMEAVSGMDIESDKSNLQKFFTGDTGLNTVLTKIPEFATKVMDAGKSLTGFASGTYAEDTTAALNFLSRLVSIFSTADITTGNSKLDSYGLSNTIWQLEELGTQLHNFYTALTGMSGDGQSFDSTVFTSITTAVADFFNSLRTATGDDGVLDRIIEAIEKIQGLFTNTEGIEGVKMDAATLFAGLDADSVATVMTDFSTNVETGVLACLTMLGEKGTEFTNAGLALATAIGTGIASYTTDFETIGYNIDMGISRGLYSGESVVTATAENVAIATYNAAAAALGIQSPSKRFAQIGMYADMGLVKGLQAYQPAVEQEASAVAESLLTSASPILANLSSLIADDVDSTPVIRPIIDLSNVESGVREMNGMFDANHSMSLSAATSARFTRDIRPTERETDTVQSDQHPVVEAIMSMGERLDQLQNAMSNLKIVLDSGTLVGETSAMMDRSLGTLAVRRNRGN